MSRIVNRNSLSTIQGQVMDYLDREDDLFYIPHGGHVIFGNLGGYQAHATADLIPPQTITALISKGLLVKGTTPAGRVDIWISSRHTEPSTYLGDVGLAWNYAYAYERYRNGEKYQWGDPAYIFDVETAHLLANHEQEVLLGLEAKTRIVMLTPPKEWSVPLPPQPERRFQDDGEPFHWLNREAQVQRLKDVVWSMAKDRVYDSAFHVTLGGDEDCLTACIAVITPQLLSVGFEQPQIDSLVAEAKALHDDDHGVEDDEDEAEFA